MKRLFLEKRKKEGVLLFAAILLFFGCAGNGNGNSVHEILMADSIAVRQIIKPYGWIVVGDKCVVHANEMDTAFYVYGLPDFEYLYCQVGRGEGPEEVSQEEILRENVSKASFWVIDWGKESVSGFTAGRDSLRRYARFRLGGDCDDPVVMINDSLAIGEGYASDGQFRMSLLNLRDGNILDSLSLKAFRQEEHGDGWSASTLVNVPGYVTDGKTLVVNYEYTDRVEFYDVSSGRLSLKKAAGDGRSVEQLQRAGLWESEKVKYYGAMAADSAYVYILETDLSRETGKSMAERFDMPEGTTLSSTVLVYDWRGDFKKKYRLDKNINRLLAYGGWLYCYNDQSDFERVYRYRLPQVD